MSDRRTLDYERPDLARPKPTAEHYAGAAAVSVGLLAVAVLMAAVFSASLESAGKRAEVMVAASLGSLAVAAFTFRLLLRAFARTSARTRAVIPEPHEQDPR